LNLLLLELQLDADLVASVDLVELGELEDLHGLGVHEDAAMEGLKGLEKPLNENRSLNDWNSSESGLLAA